MKHFLEYRRASYDLIMGAESVAGITLDNDVEAWTVHTFARYMDNPYIPSDTIATRMLRAVGESGEVRKLQLQTIAEECLLIDGLQLNHGRWPSRHYYRDMGTLACEHRAYTSRPPEIMWERIAQEWPIVCRVLEKLRV